MYSASSPILGRGVASAAAIDSWFAAHGNDPAGLGEAIVGECDAYGVNSDLVAGQICHETGYWTSTYATQRNNPAGIGAINADPGQALTFISVRAGIHAQVAHLLSYVLGAGNPIKGDDPRYAAMPARYLGSVHVLSDLDGKWAYPGVGYGASIATLANALAGGNVSDGGRPASIGGIPVAWIPAADTNWDDQRTGYDLVIVHDIEGTAAGAVATFQTVGRQGSTQFVLDPGNGRLVQMVALDAVAYGCGNYVLNQRANQFEMPGYAGQPYDPAVIDQAVQVAAYLCQRDGIPVVRLSLADVLAGKRGICGHQDIPDPNNPNLGGGVDHHTDPGPTFPWGDFLTRVAAIVGGHGTPVEPDAVQMNGHTLAHGFKAFWEHFGGLALFGLPITEEVQTTGADGKPLTVQWFERARFEWHPGSDPGHYDVMLGLVGAEALAARGGKA